MSAFHAVPAACSLETSLRQYSVASAHSFADYRQHGKTFRECVMGQVSERCGGNIVQA